MIRNRYTVWEKEGTSPRGQRHKREVAQLRIKDNLQVGEAIMKPVTCMPTRNVWLQGGLYVMAWSYTGETIHGYRT